jgi:hypothetical protein
MKRTIHFFYICLTLHLGIQEVSAQATSGGSRLNLVGKKKPTSSQDMKFSNYAAGLSYQPLSLQNPKALNKFYTSFLFSAVNSAESTAVNTEGLEKSVERKSPAVEAQMKAEEQLYADGQISVSNIYPNPASEYAEIDYTIAPAVRDAKLIFYNILGSQMNAFTLSKNERKLRVNTKDMPTGLYIYQLSVDGKKVATKKMLVRHQQ